jgi:hypothetical protein
MTRVFELHSGTLLIGQTGRMFYVPQDVPIEQTRRVFCVA